LRAPGEAWLDGKEVADVSLKVKSGVLGVEAPRPKPSQQAGSESCVVLG